MRVAIVHDWLNGMRGGEKVLEALLEMFPEAAIFTLFHEPGKVSRSIESHPIVTSYLNRIPGIYRFYRNLLPLFPSAVESWNFAGYDLVISSSHAVAKGARTPSAVHICYCHTPMRYLWDAEEDYKIGFPARLIFGAVRQRLRQWDCDSSKGVDRFIANSNFVRERIRHYYGRDSEVVPPPIDTDFFTPSRDHARGDFYLAAGALVQYKRLDVTVRAFNALGKRLVIAGAGPELKKIRRMAGSNIDVRGRVSSEGLRRLYRTARALVYAAREDFGMVAVEAQSCGCPVIAFSAGGLAHIVRDSINGLFFAEQHADDLIDAIRRFEKKDWPQEQVSDGVEKFSRGTFQSRFRKIVESHAPEIARSRFTGRFA